MRETIRSLSNPKIRQAAALKEKKYRDGEGLFLVEGKKMVREGLSLGAEIVTIFATEKLAGEFPEKLTFPVSEEVFSKLSDEVSPEGVIAVLKKPAADLSPAAETCLFLDGLRDPGNVGTILRTAAACGVKRVFAANCCDCFSPKVIRSSMSGIYFVRVTEGKREELLPLIRPLPVVVTDMAGENVFSAKVQKPFCLVVGSEAFGVSDQLSAAADKTVSLPMEKNVESLNAAISLSVILYTLINQR